MGFDFDHQTCCPLDYLILTVVSTYGKYTNSFVLVSCRWWC